MRSGRPASPVVSWVLVSRADRDLVCQGLIKSSQAGLRLEAFGKWASSHLRCAAAPSVSSDEMRRGRPASPVVSWVLVSRADRDLVCQGLIKSSQAGLLPFELLEGS